MACNTKHGPATAIRFYEQATGVKLTQQDWHLIREAVEADKGSKLSRARVDEWAAADAFNELVRATNKREHAVKTDAAMAQLEEFVAADNTEGTLEMLRHLAAKGLPQTVTSRTRRGTKATKLPATGDEGIVIGMTNQCPACHQFSGEGHTCPPEQLREFAVATDTHAEALYLEQWGLRQNLAMQEDTLRRMSGQKRDLYSRGRQQWSGTLEDAIADLEAKAALARANGDYFIAGGNSYSATPDKVDEVLAKYGEGLAEMDRLKADLQADEDLHEQFGWNRAFLVVNNGGHVHKSMGCSTCYDTTKFNWLPSYSGSDEDQIVADAGERACTVCYPSAPVDVLSRPTKIFSEEERQQVIERDKRRVELAAKKSEKAAKAPTASGEPLRVVVGQRSSYRDPSVTVDDVEEFKTERTAVTWAVDALAETWRPVNDHEKAAVDVIVAALAEKRGVASTEVRAEIDAKAAAKKKKQEREAAKWQATNS